MTKKHKQPSKKAVTVTRIIIGVLILATAVSVFFLLRSITDKRTLLDQGKQAMGVVENINERTTISRSTSLTTHQISYSFIPDGSNEKVIKNGFYVSEEQYGRYRTGSEIPITYLPNDPSMNQPDASLRHMSAIAIPFVFLVLATISAIFCVRITQREQAKYNIKQPSILFYITLLAGLMIAFFFAAALTNGISYLVSLLLM